MIRHALFLSMTLLVLVATLFSCGGKEEAEVPVDAIARVYDKYLLKEDLQGIIPENTDPKDSIKLVENFIQNWIRENLMLEHADKNLPEEAKDFNKQLEAYKRSLLVYTFEQALIAEKLDTNIGQESIVKYYDENEDNFTLRESITRVDYVKVLNSAPKLSEIKKLFKSKDDEKKEELQEYCLSYAKNFSLGTNDWYTVDQLKGEFPETIDWENQSFLKGQVTEEKDSLFTYVIRLRDYQKRNGPAPLSYVQEDIINIILNKRKLELINQMKKDILLRAESRNNFEIF